MESGTEIRRGARWAGAVALVAGALVAGAPTAAAGQVPVDGLEARVWLGRGEAPVVHRGDRVRLYYRTSRDAYVAIFHLDTDGTVRLLHPRVPGRDHYTRGRRDYRLLFPHASHWQVDEDPGVGYFFLVASERPLDFSAFDYSSRVGWDLSVVGRRVYRDPFLAMEDYLAHLVPGASGRVHALDYVEYHVGREYRYPRFVCYDCHRFRPYVTWNPYHYQCRSFRLVIFTDPYFYPVYRYRGTRVVYRRPPALPYGRFAFKERAADEPRTPIYRSSDEAEIPGLRVPERRRGSGTTAGGASDRPRVRLDGGPADDPRGREADRRRPSTADRPSPADTPGTERPGSVDRARPPAIRPDASRTDGGRAVPDRPILQRRPDGSSSPDGVGDGRDEFSPRAPDPRVRPDRERAVPDRDRATPDRERASPDRERASPDRERATPDRRPAVPPSRTERPDRSDRGPSAGTRGGGDRDGDRDPEARAPRRPDARSAGDAERRPTRGPDVRPSRRPGAGPSNRPTPSPRATPSRDGERPRASLGDSRARGGTPSPSARRGPPR